MTIDAYLKRNEAERRVNSPTECLDLLRDFTGLEEDKYAIGSGRGLAHVFRGHDRADYPLKTALDRIGGTKKRRAEDFLLREFRRRVHQYFDPGSIPQSDLVTLALMQQYGIPTRLLDVTRSPYVALYFAVRDTQKEQDAAVWVFNIINIRQASLRRVFKKDSSLQQQIGNFYDPSGVFTRQEFFKEWFLPDVPLLNLDDSNSLAHHEIIFLFDPYKIDTRRAMQQSLFLASGSPYRTFEETLVDLLEEIESQIGESGGHDPSVFKIVIPREFRCPLMRHLEKMNITANSLFEGTEGFADYLREKLAIMDNDFLGDLLGLPT